MFMPTSSYLSASMDPSYVGTARVLVVWPRSIWEKNGFFRTCQACGMRRKKIYRFFLMTKSLLAQTGVTSYSYWIGDIIPYWWSLMAVAMPSQPRQGPPHGHGSEVRPAAQRGGTRDAAAGDGNQRQTGRFFLCARDEMNMIKPFQSLGKIRSKFTYKII